MLHTTYRILLVLLLSAAATTGCRQVVPVEPQYDRPLPPGAGVFGLRQVTDPARLPDMGAIAAQLADSDFQSALQRSLGWFAIDSTRRFYPMGPISHAHARLSVYALSQLGQVARSDPHEALRKLQQEFDVWESVGWDGRGTVLFTAYYSPVFHASRSRTGRYQFPLYRKPADLVTDPATGSVHGRQTAGGIVTYATRRQIEQHNLLAGQELVYLPDKLDAYIIHVNGAAKLNLADGSVMHVGYAGNNGHQYTSLGKALVDDGKLAKGRVSLPAIHSYFKAHPDQLDGYLQRNDRFIFFGEYDGSSWPAGSLGFQVTPMRSLATDKAIFPRGMAVWVDTQFPTRSGLGNRPLGQLMLDQDTGGAIRAAGRADIYVGVGPDAELVAGRQAAEGKLYYLLLKPQRLNHWSKQ